jgi:hypothetical protein
VHNASWVETRGEAINDDLVFCILLLGRFPPNLQVLTFEFHLEIQEGVLDIDISEDPHDGCNPIRTVVAAVLIKKLLAVLTNLGGRGFGFISRSRMKGPGY